MKFCLDRREGEFAVCLCEDANNVGRQYDFALSDNAALRTLAEGTVFTAELSAQGTLTALVVLKEETEQRRAQAKARLAALFARKAKK